MKIERHRMLIAVPNLRNETAFSDCIKKLVKAHGMQGQRMHLAYRHAESLPIHGDPEQTARGRHMQMRHVLAEVFQRGKGSIG